MDRRICRTCPYLSIYAILRAMCQEQHGGLIRTKIGVPRSFLWYKWNRVIYVSVIYLFIPRGWYVVTTLWMNRICESSCIIYVYKCSSIIEREKLNFHRKGIFWLDEKQGGTFELSCITLGTEQILIPWGEGGGYGTEIQAIPHAR